MDRKILLTLAALLIVQMGCIIGRPTVTPEAPLLPAPAEGTQPIVTQAPGSMPTGPAGDDPGDETLVPPAPGGNGPLALQILAPEDGAAVNTPQVEVIGLTAPNSVVTVNDDILVVGEDGRFESTVSLEEGPNVIEIVASDLEGNEASLLLTVVYQP